MRINTALILCAGFGKRLNPITLNTPKPLLQIKDISMLERCINLIEKLGIQKIVINTFYLKDQFSEFLHNKNFNLDIKIIEDGEHILDTGGGIHSGDSACSLPPVSIKPFLLKEEYFLFFLRNIFLPFLISRLYNYCSKLYLD